MLDLPRIERIRLRGRPRFQRVVGWTLLTPNYELPPRVRIDLEGVEHLPDEPVLLAMNHTDRYNYWPFQYAMWRRGDLPYTATWVKGKYYENPLVSWFFDRCNNIPLPSKGYLIFQDARTVLDRRLTDDEYRVLRDLVDRRRRQQEILEAPDCEPDMHRLLTMPRRDFEPAEEAYADFMERWNDRLMSLVEQRTVEALFEHGNNLIVFPQGTRSLRLLPGKPGLAQFALRHEVPVVPVGSMGSEEVYPGASPWAGGGRILYRIGEPMSVEDAFADCRIEEPYTPFTREADPYADRFERATERITLAINELLEPPYQLADEEDDERRRADRFI